MSNRRKLSPPPAVSRYVAAYRCTDCTGKAERTYNDDGVWHVVIEHDDGCPVLTGSVDAMAANIAAIEASGQRGVVGYLKFGGGRG